MKQKLRAEIYSDIITMGLSGLPVDPTLLRSTGTFPLCSLAALD